MSNTTKKHSAPAGMAMAIEHWWQRKHRLREELVLAGVLSLALLGIAITNISPASSYRYWLVIMGLFALAGMVLAGLRSHQKGLSVSHVALDQLVHWGATFGAVLAVFIMLGAGRLTYEATGLMILLLLGLAMFLDGYYRAGWRFSLLGILIVILALAAAWLSAYIWPILIAGAVIWPLSILAEIRLGHKLMNRVDNGARNAKKPS